MLNKAIPSNDIISLSLWRKRLGITACTTWRWRKRGWLKTTNICGKLYLTREAVDEFNKRASNEEFAQRSVTPKRSGQEGAK